MGLTISLCTYVDYARTSQLPSLCRKQKHLSCQSLPLLRFLHHKCSLNRIPRSPRSLPRQKRKQKPSKQPQQQLHPSLRKQTVLPTGNKTARRIVLPHRNNKQARKQLLQQLTEQPRPVPHPEACLKRQQLWRQPLLWCVTVPSMLHHENVLTRVREKLRSHRTLSTSDALLSIAFAPFVFSCNLGVSGAACTVDVTDQRNSAAGFRALA